MRIAESVKVDSRTHKPCMVKACLSHGNNDLPSDTPLYKYLSIEAFLYLLHFNELTFSRFASWPDAYEGFRFQFLKELKKDRQFSGFTQKDFLGSCWSLQTEDRRLYDNEKAFARAMEDLQINGSASMWETYCRNGGVRIKTSIGKIDERLQRHHKDFQIFRGAVYYEARTDWQKTTKSGLISSLFMKPVAFRHESEYRYILLPNISTGKVVVTVPFGDLFEFVDDVLVSPATKSNKWISRTLYNIVCKIAIARKHQKQFCKISQLYGQISLANGNRHMT